MQVYLDNAATTPAAPEVAEAVADALLRRFGNPSSAHRWGIDADGILAVARRRLGDLLGVAPERIFFTSGGTEANNLALFGLARRTRALPGRRIVTTAIEHSSLLEAAAALGAEGWEVVRLPVAPDGTVTAAQVAEAAARAEAAIVALAHVNNEVGTVQPIAEIAASLRRLPGRPALHVDAVQALGKVPLAVGEWGLDACAVSAHKVHGPKGVGALYVRAGRRLAPLLRGGDQQDGLRPGTENVPGIAGFSAALGLVAGDGDAPTRIMAHKLRLWAAIRKLVPDAAVNGPEPERAAPHILNVRLTGLGVPGEVLLHALEAEGVACSAGSACHARRPEPSHVLVALGLPPRAVRGSIRLSLSRLTSGEEVEAAAAAIARALAGLRTLAVRR